LTAGSGAGHEKFLPEPSHGDRPLGQTPPIVGDAYGGTGLSDASDDDLLCGARAGDRAAFDELYERHRGAALRLARSYRRHGDPEDLVSGAFEKVLGALLRGNGPTESFRAYLFVTLRRLAAEDARHPAPEPLDIVPETVMAVSGLPGLDDAERRMITEAFEALPDRWQAILWLTAVEGRHPREVARSAGIPANTVSVLAHRARERLREAYLQAHLRAAPVAACEPHRSRLGGYVRGGLGRRHRRATGEHLETCPLCRDLVIELTDVNRQLVRSVLPLFVLASGGSIVRPLTASAAGVTGAAAGAAGAPAGISAVVGTGTAAATAAGAGAGASAVKVAVAAAAAIAALTVSLVPDLGRPGGGDGPPQAFATGAPPGSGQSTTTISAPAEHRSMPSPSGTPTTASRGGPPADVDAGGDVAPADATPPSTGTAGGELVDVDVGVDAGPVLDLDAGVEVGPGVEIDASWTSSLLGTGTLTVDVLNPEEGAAAALTMDIQLSSHARATTLLSSGCQASDPGLIGVVLSLVGALTCTLGELTTGAGATVDVPLHVSGPGETAAVVLRTSSGEVLDRSVVALPPT
jgi:RNA polymerase sigma factor (sigma-70 family)